MTSQTSVTTRLPHPQNPNVSQSTIAQPLTQFHNPHTRPRPPYTQSAPNIFTNVSNASSSPIQSAQQPKASTNLSSKVLERPPTTRGYTTHVPHNPDRPPPHTYQRQHEFPPFPPLAQHPVLPFLTTAFANSSESQAATPPPTRSRPTIAPRASTTQRHVHSNVSTIPTMDVSRNDPTATFVRPPLLVPRSRNADPSIDPATLNGIVTDSEPVPGMPLTYAILHTHRNWFLDAEDFRKDNPNRMDYPHALEPPRGWAPLSECTGAGAANRCKQAKEKKEKNNAVRTKGSYAHGETADTTIEYGPSDDCHEKTVLRCTFCRREYHGPNAKSMWRRHVFDKHKVPMKNRREGSAGMAPKVANKKGKAKTAGSSNETSPASAELDTPALTLDLNNEENIIRLLERVVSGNLDINLPASLLNSGGLNLETIALALQKSGISFAVEDAAASSPTPSSLPLDNGRIVDPNPVAKKMNGKNRRRQEQRRERERRDMEILKAAAGPSLGLTDDDDVGSPDAGQSSVDDVPDSFWPSEPNSTRSQTSPPTSHSDIAQFNTASLPRGLKRRIDDEPSLIARAPLKDNTAHDRSNRNSDMPGTPRKNKGKQRALPLTPDGPRITQTSLTSPPLNPFTPLRHPSMTALRSCALATTGEESYLTLILSSPAAESPIRDTGRVSFTSPFHRTSPLKRSHRDGPASDDVLRDLGASSPSYTFEFNIQGAQPGSSPSYLSAFEPIPLDLGTMGPAHWTPPSLGPPAPVSEPTSRSLSRASSVHDDIGLDQREITSDQEDKDMELKYPEWSSPLERLQYHRPKNLETSGTRVRDEDFDMDAYLDLEDAGPSSEAAHSSTAQKLGLQFSREYGLLTPEEVERITASARPTFVDELRSSKRRKVDSAL